MNELMTALAAASAELTNPVKDKTAKAGAYSYTYANLASVLDIVRPILARHGLVVVQDVMLSDHRVNIITTVWHTSGESLTFGPLSGPTGDTWQTLGGAITYARRYALMAALGLAADDDDTDAQNSPVSHPTGTTTLRGPAARHQATGPATPAQKGKVRHLMSEARVSEVVMAEFCADRLGFEWPVDGVDALTGAQASTVIQAMTQKLGSRPAPRPGIDYTPEGATDGTVGR
jgi:hypothetical protein